MQRRTFVLAGAAGLALPAAAHHGWSSFDTESPLLLEGTVAQVSWRNPHVELVLNVTGPARLPEDITSLPLPRQSAEVDGTALLAKTRLPTRKDKRWTI